MADRELREHEAVEEIARLVRASKHAGKQIVWALRAMRTDKRSIAQLRRQLADAHQHESYWRDRCLEAERGESKLCDAVATLKEQLGRSDAGTVLDVMLTLPAGVALVVTQGERPDVVHIRVKDATRAHVDVNVRVDHLDESHFVRLVRKMLNRLKTLHHELGGEG